MYTYIPLADGTQKTLFVVNADSQNVAGALGAAVKQAMSIHNGGELLNVEYVLLRHKEGGAKDALDFLVTLHIKNKG